MKNECRIVLSISVVVLFVLTGMAIVAQDATAAPPKKMPDLMVYDISWFPSNPEPEEDVTITTTIANIGTKDIRNTIFSNYVRISGPGTSYVWYEGISNLKVGSYASFDVTTTWGLNEGSYALYVHTDDRYWIDESNEDNNIRTEYMDVSSPENSPPVATIDSVTPDSVAKGGSMDFMGSASDPDGDPIISYRWERWTSESGHGPGEYIDTIGSTQDIVGFYTGPWDIGTYFIMFYAYDGEDWSAPAPPVMIKVYREWYECPQPCEEWPLIDYRIRVFERDVDGNGVIDSVNLFMDVNAYWGEEAGWVCLNPPLTDPIATIWIELQGYYFSGDYWSTEVTLPPETGNVMFPGTEKTNSGFYGSDQRMVLNAVVNVQYGQSIQIPETDQSGPHTVVVEELLLYGFAFGPRVFCWANYIDGSGLPNAPEIIWQYNLVWEITSEHWPMVGDGDGIKEWMSQSGCPDTRYFEEFAVADLNLLPSEPCYIDFIGYYHLGIYGTSDGSYVTRYWSTFGKPTRFGFFLFDETQLFYDDFNDGNADGWSKIVTGGSVGCLDPEIPGGDEESMYLLRDSDTDGGVSVWHSFTAQTGHIYAQAMIAVSTDDSNRWAYFALRDSANAYVTHVVFKDGQIRYYDGVWRYLDVTVSYDASVWYTIAVDVDIANQVYDIYVDGQLVKNDAAFYGSHTDVASVYFQAGWFDVASPFLMTVDQVLIET